MLHLAEHGSDLSKCVALQLERNNLYPGRVFLPKSKDFIYIGQLGLCNATKEGLIQLDQYMPDQTSMIFHFPNSFKGQKT